MDRAEFFALLADRPTAELAHIQLAYWLAKNAHRYFTRDNGERYFEHPRGVAVSLITHGFKRTNFIVIGLLHDVIEDTNTPGTVIVDLFGPETWTQLETLSRYIPLFNLITGQIMVRHKKTLDEYYEEIWKAVDLVKIVKCADRLHNLQTCGAWADDRRKRYIEETQQRVLPLARELRLSYEQELEATILELEKGGP